MCAFLSILRNRSRGVVPFGRGGTRSTDAGFAGAVFFVWRIRVGGTLKAAGNGGWMWLVCLPVCPVAAASRADMPGGMRGQGIRAAAGVAGESGDRAL